MEGKTKTAIGTISRDKSTAPESDHQNGLPPVHKKKKSANLLKAGLYLLRMKSRKSSKSISKSKSSNQVDHHDHDHVGSKFSWKGLVGSMRPMHLQGHQSHPTLAMEAKPAALPENKQTTLGEYEEAEANNTAPFCPKVKESPSTISMSSSYGSVSDMSSHGSVSDMSQYESPLTVLPEVKSGHTTFWYGGDDEDDSGDEMIDAKAEEFIAQFYQQMRLQNLNC